MTKKVDNSSNRPENIIYRVLDWVGQMSVLRYNGHKEFNAPGGVVKMMQKSNPELYNDMIKMDDTYFNNIRDEDIKKVITPAKPLSEWVAESRDKK